MTLAYTQSYAGKLRNYFHQTWIKKKSDAGPLKLPKIVTALTGEQVYLHVQGHEFEIAETNKHTKADSDNHAFYQTACEKAKLVFCDNEFEESLSKHWRTMDQDMRKKWETLAEKLQTAEYLKDDTDPRIHKYVPI